jgi:hypothetical protein
MVKTMYNIPKEKVVDALAEAGGAFGKAAKLLGINTTVMVRLIRIYGLEESVTNKRGPRPGSYKEELSRLLDEHNGNVEEVAKVLGKGVEAVKNAAFRYGIKDKIKRKVPDKEAVLEAFSSSNYVISSSARKLKMSSGSAVRWAKFYQVEIPARVKLDKESVIHALSQNNGSMRAASTLLGVKYNTLYRFIMRNQLLECVVLAGN